MQEILIHAAKEFVKLFGELLFLFTMISFFFALMQMYISREKIKNLLSTPIKPINSVLGTLLGVITPFCSCSTIPVLTDLIRSGAPFCGVRTETMIPIASILIGKGVSARVVITLIIGGAVASLPELSLLSSIFKRKMIVTFVSCVFIVAIVTGFAFNIMI